MELTDEQQSAIHKMYTDGKGSTKISSELGIGKKYVLRYLHDSGIFREPVEHSEELKQQIVHEYKNGSSINALSKKYNLGTGYLCNYFKKLGIKRDKSECYGKQYRDYKCGSEHPNWIERYTVNCAYCNEEIQRTEWDVKQGSGIHFCSQDCRKLWNMENLNGKNAPGFVNGSSYGKYCEKFNAFFKRRVRAYMGNTCLLCGKSKEENGNRDMSVHHVFGNKKVCCDTDDRVMFAPLCMACHKTVEGNDIYQDALLCIIHVRFNDKCYYTIDEWKELNLGNDNKEDENDDQDS